MIPKPIVILLSGGLDSVTALYDAQQAGCVIFAVSFDYSQQHVREIEFAKFHCDRLGVKHWTEKIPALGGLTDEGWIVPHRNAVLISHGTSIAIRHKAEAVIIGCNSGDAENFPDCRPEFIAAMNAVNKAAACNVEIIAPYIHKPKAWIAGVAKEFGIPSDMIWTCYRGGEKPCGECPACKKLQSALGR